MKIDLYKDGIGFITDDVSTVKASQSNINEENRIKFVTDLAAVSRGKDSALNPTGRFKSLMKEAAPTDNQIFNFFASTKGDKIQKSPSRPLEFLPIVVTLAYNFFEELSCGSSKICGEEINDETFMNDIMPFSYLEGNKLYTNMRALINAGIPYDNIPYNTEEELKEFKAFRANIPMFVFNHLITHTALSKEAQSDRVTKNPNYWLPSDFRDKVYMFQKNNPIYTVDGDNYLVEKSKSKDILSLNNKEDIVNYLLENFSQNEIQTYLKNLGYKKEIYQRAMLEFRYKEVVMTAWNNNPKTFKHFMVEREAYPEIHTSWVQEQTRLLAEGMKTILDYK